MDGARCAAAVIEAEHLELGKSYLHCEGTGELLFTENETNSMRLWGVPNGKPFVKDGINGAIVSGARERVNPDFGGTKAAAHYLVDVGPGATSVIRLRLTQTGPKGGFKPFANVDAIMEQRRWEADEFYSSITPPSLSEDVARVMRQALAGMLWTKQYYFFDLERWLAEHNADLTSSSSRAVRNRDWYHMVNSDVISMPGKWEYPWYAAWDLAFHTLALSVVDLDFSREQLRLMLDGSYLHPNRQMPAYEWNFGDVNPPVHAWATNFSHSIDDHVDQNDFAFFKRAFSKLLLNFSWWVNRKDPTGRNVFNGGFRGLDNIGVFDRSSALPTGEYLEQADGTAWMAFYSLNMLSLAILIARRDPDYEEFTLQFVEHFLRIAGAMDRVGDNQDELWDEEDGFFYDLLVLPDGSPHRIRVRSMVGLLPLMAVSIVSDADVDTLRAVMQKIRTFLAKNPNLLANIHDLAKPGVNNRHMLAIMDESKLRRILARMPDEEQFLSPLASAPFRASTSSIPTWSV